MCETFGWYCDQKRCSSTELSRSALFLRAALNIPIQTHIISPWLLFCKMIISHLEYGPLVIDVALTSNKSYKR